MKTVILTVLSLLVVLGLGSQSRADTSKFDKQMQPVLKEYLKIPEALAKDTTKGVTKAAAKIRSLAKKL
ncbi:MAG: hypothetical protein ACYTFZ_08305, partial [Planctomycetota bacterium]